MIGKNTSKRKKVFTIIIVAILLVIIVILAGINFYLEHLVREKIDTQLNKPGGLYTLTVDDIDIHIFRGNLTLHNLNVIPTDTARSILAAGGIKSLTHATVGDFKIRGISLIKFLRGKDVKIRKIAVSEINLEQIVNKEAHPEKKNHRSLQDQIGKELNAADIGQFDLQNITFRLINFRNDSIPDFEIDSVFLIVKDIHLDQNTLEKSFPVTFSEIKLNTGHFELNNLAHYVIKTDDIHFRLADSTILLDGFKLKPKHSKQAYNKLIKYNNDWFDIATESIVIKGINMHELELNKMINLLSVSIESPDIKIYRDKNLPDAPFKYKPLLAGLIKKIPLPICIDTLLVKNGKLVYEELTPTSDIPGMVNFDPLFISVYNITNQPDRLSLNNLMEVDFHGRIMGASNLNANLKIDLNSDYETFSASGLLEPVDGAAFNPMVENLLLVSIKEGKIHKAEFTFDATDDLSQGELFLDYENIKVEVHKHKDSEKRSGAMSFVANEVLNNKNLPEDKRYRTGNIYFERRKDKALVNYLWNSTKTGIISVVAPIADKTKKEIRQAEQEEKKDRKDKKKEKTKN
jgi:hypothetical protein